MASPSTFSRPLSVSLNGKDLVLDGGGVSLQTLLRLQGHDPEVSAFACAVNSRFVPRGAWSQCELQAGDRIDVVAPVTGG